jgi:tellurite resistance protein TerC
VDVANNPAVRFISSHMPVTRELHGQRFFVRIPDDKTAKLVTPPRPCSSPGGDQPGRPRLRGRQRPAIFAITTDTFIVYTSNIMAILGLRALYFALAAMVHRFHYLKYALAAVLVFIGSKIFVADFLLGGDKFPPVLSLGVTFALIAAGIAYSLWKTRGAAEPDWPAGTVPDDPARHG